MSQTTDTPIIRAAGGIVWEGELWRSRIAVIHRNRYRDWTLPKGKLEEGESFADAAIREIKEETGCTVELRDFAGYIEYMKDGRPKLVKFWHAMLVGEPEFQPNQEVARLEWLSINEAITRLDYDSERQLIERPTLPNSVGSG